jgi:hypothetical protein
MHCASSRSKPHPRRRHSWASAALAAVLIGALGAAPARAEAGFVFCLNDHGAKIFAGRPEAGGFLRFGLSVWSPAGRNLSVFGTAKQHDHGWQYVETRGATVAERCRLMIARAADGGLTVSAATDATCASHGGINTSVGTIRFPRGALEGPVTTELDDSEAFQKAGKCVGTPQRG